MDAELLPPVRRGYGGNERWGGATLGRKRMTKRELLQYLEGSVKRILARRNSVFTKGSQTRIFWRMRTENLRKDRAGISEGGKTEKREGGHDKTSRRR